eukprot:m51a1_g5093 hypothetical protein (372) ;mRNA; f:270148-272070
MSADSGEQPRRRAIPGIAHIVRTELQLTGQTQHHVAVHLGGGSSGDGEGVGVGGADGAAQEEDAPRDTYMMPQSMAASCVPQGLGIGTFLCLPSGCASAESGEPINDLFCVEAAVHHRGAVLLALRWYALHSDVVGLSPHQLARTECWQLLDLQTIADQMAGPGLGGMDAVAVAEAHVRQRVVVDYVNALLATRSELGAAGVTFDDAYWAPERYVLPWAAWVAGSGASCLSNSDVVLDSIRGDILLLRQPFIQRQRTPLSQPEEHATLLHRTAAAPAGLTAGDIEDVSALLATAEPSPEERELSRALDLLTDMEPQDCSTVLGIVRLASAGRQSLLKLSRHISLNRVFGPLLLAANSSKNDGSSSKSSNGC